jgi:hypothetical protein
MRADSGNAVATYAAAAFDCVDDRFAEWWCEARKILAFSDTLGARLVIELVPFAAHRATVAVASQSSMTVLSYQQRPSRSHTRRGRPSTN